jgi:hypothetical protein
MKKIQLIIVFLLAVSIKQTTAQQTVYVGIPRDKFNYYASDQHNTNWCWAASLQMIFNYYGVNITQEQIVKRTYGTDATGRLPNSAGTFPAITQNLNNWSVDNNGKKYKVTASMNWGAPSASYLVQELEAQHPILIGYSTGAYSGHAVVVTACSYVETSYGPMIQSIVVRDPWPSSQNESTNGRVEYAGVNLANLIQAHWYVRVSY